MHKPLILAALLVAAFAINLDTTIVNVALPTLVHELHASNAQLQWIVDAYNLVFAALLLASGSLSDRAGLMYGFPAFYAAGKMVACVYGSGVVLRLAPEEASELRGLPSRAFEPYGRRMRAWTFLEPAAPEELCRETAALQAAIDRARRDGGPK